MNFDLHDLQGPTPPTEKCPSWCDIAITHHHVNIPPDVPKVVVPTHKYLGMRHALRAAADSKAFNMLPHSVQDRIRLHLE